MKNTLIEFYLDYVNNFLTTSGMAEYYGIFIIDCEALIKMGRWYHEENVKKLKSKI